MGFFRGYRLTAFALVGVLIPQFAVTQVGQPRIVVEPLAVPVKKAAKRILAYHKPASRDLAGIAGRIAPSWAKQAPATYENDSFLSDLQVSSSDRALFDQGDIMSRQQILEMQQSYGDMNRDLDQRSHVYGLTNPDSLRVQYDKMKDFTREMFKQVRKFQSSIYRGKLNQVANRDENLKSAPVRVVGSISAVYFDSPVMIALSEETRISAHTNIPDQTGALNLTSPVINGAIELDGHAEEALAPGTVPVDPTWKREKYRVSFSRPLGVLDMTSGISYGSTTTQVSASVSKPITDQVTCVVDSVRPLNAPGASSEERVKVLYGIRF
jgi:hypothetical protein